MFPVIIRQSSLGVSICPMLAWKREGEGLEQAAQGVGLYLFYWIKKQCTKPKALGPKQESTHGRCTPGWGGGRCGRPHCPSCLSRQHVSARICVTLSWL